jgi:hypothetical protein
MSNLEMFGVSMSDDSTLRLERAEKATAAVMAELVRATGKHGRFNSPHEAYAILLEEVDELWDDIKKNRSTTAYIEAIQVAAMAVRFVVDCGLWDANGDLIDPSQF